MSNTEKAGRIAFAIWMIFMLWILISWVDVMTHNVADGNVQFWRYNAFCILLEIIG